MPTTPRSATRRSDRRHPDRAGRTGGGVAMTWPFAVTEICGKLHALSRRARARPSPISRVRSTSERPTSNTPLTLPAVWDFRSTLSWCRCSTCLPSDPGSLFSERQRGLRLATVSHRHARELCASSRRQELGAPSAPSPGRRGSRRSQTYRFVPKEHRGNILARGAARRLTRATVQPSIEPCAICTA
jgi:hypothetical protein